MRAPWWNKAALVEWDLTGDASHGFGAVVYLSAAPALIVHELGGGYRNEADVAAAIDEWISTVSDRYRLDRRFQDFKALARALDDSTEADIDRGGETP